MSGIRVTTHVVCMLRRSDTCRRSVKGSIQRTVRRVAICAVSVLLAGRAFGQIPDGQDLSAERDLTRRLAVMQTAAASLTRTTTTDATLKSAVESLLTEIDQIRADELLITARNADIEAALKRRGAPATALARHAQADDARRHEFEELYRRIGAVAALASSKDA